MKKKLWTSLLLLVTLVGVLAVGASATSTTFSEQVSTFAAAHSDQYTKSTSFYDADVKDGYWYELGEYTGNPTEITIGDVTYTNAANQIGTSVGNNAWLYTYAYKIDSGKISVPIIAIATAGDATDTDVVVSIDGTKFTVVRDYSEYTPSSVSVYAHGSADAIVEEVDGVYQVTSDAYLYNSNYTTYTSYSGIVFDDVNTGDYVVSEYSYTTGRFGIAKSTANWSFYTYPFSAIDEIEYTLYVPGKGMIDVAFVEGIVSESGLTTAVAAGGDITLGADITLTGSVIIPEGMTVTIPAGKTLTNNGTIVVDDPKDNSGFLAAYSGAGSDLTSLINGVRGAGTLENHGTITTDYITGIAGVVVDGGTINSYANSTVDIVDVDPQGTSNGYTESGMLIGDTGLSITDGYVTVGMANGGAGYGITLEGDATISGDFQDADEDGYRIAGNDVFTVASGSTLTIDHRTEVSGDLVVKDGGEVIVSSGKELYVFTPVSDNNYVGDLKLDGTLTINGTVDTSGGTIAGSGSAVISSTGLWTAAGADGSTDMVGSTSHSAHITLATNSTATLDLEDESITINGNADIYSTTYAVYYTATGVRSVADIIIASGTFTTNSGSSLYLMADGETGSLTIEEGATVTGTVESGAYEGATMIVDGTYVNSTDVDTGYSGLYSWTNVDEIWGWNFTGTAPTATLSTSAGSGYVTVTWAVTDGGIAGTAYTLTYVKDGVTEELDINGLTGSVKVTGLTNSTTYTFELTATNAAGEDSATVTGTPKSSSSGNTGTVVSSGSSSTSSSDDDDAEDVTEETTDVEEETTETTEAEDTTEATLTTQESANLEATGYTDVAEDDWHAEAVQYVVESNLFQGTSSNGFSPETPMSREMTWVVLARLNGMEMSGATAYADALEWALENGITDGTYPSDAVSREQLVTLLWRNAGSPEAEGDLSAYDDADAISDYAQAAMAWAIENGIISGMDATTLNPTGEATRAHVAQIMMNLG